MKLNKIWNWVILLVVTIGLAVGTTVITHKVLNDRCGNSDYNYQIYRSRVELAMEGTRDRIVTDIDHYIDSIAPDSGLNGIKLFEMCEKYGVDVRFVLAQGQAESHFGTKGMAAKTNIVWNVNTRDNDTLEDIRRRKDDYSHPDKSIEPYLQLLVNKYLVNTLFNYAAIGACFLISLIRMDKDMRPILIMRNLCWVFTIESMMKPN